jgi:hypothetical protein
MANPVGALANLMAAEVEFLTAFGWTRLTVKMRHGPAVIRYKCPRTGDEMDRWVAVARQKTHCNFPE